MPTVAISKRVSLTCHWLCQCLFALAVAAPLWAAEERLCDRPPFDQILLDEVNKSAVLNVEPLDLPERKMPAQPQGEITIRLIADPTRPFDVSWQSIRKVAFFEEVLLAEAQRLTGEGKFDDAFDYYARLLREYPTLPGLNEAANDFLRRNAVQLFQSQQLDRALAVLTALYERQPNTPGLLAAVDGVCGKMIEQQLRDKNYTAARGVLDLWQQKFSVLDSPNAAAWEQRFATAAERQVNEARQNLADKKYVAARKAIGRARDIWPEYEPAHELLAELQRKNPSVSVGVFEASPRRPVRRIDDWASLRASRLLEPTITEIISFGSEGGVYRSRYGEWVPDERGMRLSLKLANSAGPQAERGPSADFIARFFLNMADPTRPEYKSDFAAVLAGVSVEGTEWVHLDWKRPHVRPEALLQLPLTKLAIDDDGRETIATITPAAWDVADSEPGSMALNAIPPTNGPQPWLRTIVEQTMPDDQTAVAALLHGEIDVLDRVPPWQLERLRAAKAIRVESYKLPTVHVLILNPAKALSRQREFRRALCFGIQRDRIVKQVLLGGAEVPGFTVLSGPFPAGQSFNDPVRYAYNNQIEPRPFEPRLAAVLATVAWSKVLDPKGQGNIELSPMPKLVLAHPTDPVARVACETIQLQLAKAGILIKLVEFTADELLAGKVEYDLRYAELAVWEPVADARALLGPGGLAGELGSPYLTAALRELDDATNWKDVRAKLSEIHDVAHHDLPLIPLWQTVNFFAYRTAVQGIGDSPVSLYQDVDQWRVGADNTVAGLRN
ncbi:MAG: ABC transporter substrate-binding protein [Pirellulales bacterium]